MSETAEGELREHVLPYGPVYLAGPVHTRGDHGTHWREGVAGDLKSRGIAVANPLSKYVDGESDEEWDPEEIVANDLGMVRNAAAVLVNYRGEPAFGTWMEVREASEVDVPVIVVWGCDLSVSPWVQHHADVVVETMTAGVDAVEQVLADDLEDDSVAPEQYDVEAAVSDILDVLGDGAPTDGDEMASAVAEDVATLLTDSRDTHGDAIQNQEHIASGWTWVLDGADKLVEDTEITGMDVAKMMGLVKMSRDSVGDSDVDHYRDIAGYGAIGGACLVDRGQADIEDLRAYSGGDGGE